jgi:hypothetical protein
MKKFKNTKTNGVPLPQATPSTMKYCRFSRRRKSIFYVRDPILKRKSDYMINTGRSKILSAIFFENPVWGALHKAWKRYVIAKEKWEDDKMELYAHRIQEPQHDLGLPISSFDNIGMSAASFLWELAQKDDDNQEQQVAEEGNYLGDRQYEEERFTDAYSEYF